MGDLDIKNTVRLDHGNNRTTFSMQRFIDNKLANGLISFDNHLVEVNNLAGIILNLHASCNRRPDLHCGERNHLFRKDVDSVFVTE